MQGPVPTTLLCVLAGLASVALVVNGKNFDQFLTCSACIAAGHGWNAAKYRCGGYKTRHCAPGAGNLNSSSFCCNFNSSSFCLKSRTCHSASVEPRVLKTRRVFHLGVRVKERESCVDDVSVFCKARPPLVSVLRGAVSQLQLSELETLAKKVRRTGPANAHPGLAAYVLTYMYCVSN